MEYASINGKTVTSLNPLKEKLFSNFAMSVSKEAENKKNREEVLSNIYQSFEASLNRSLQPMEISTIREWVALGYSDETIINALKEALSQGKKTLKSVDKILLSWAKREDIETEGKTPIDDEWSKNLEETIHHRLEFCLRFQYLLFWPKIKEFYRQILVSFYLEKEPL